MLSSFPQRPPADGTNSAPQWSRLPDDALLIFLSYYAQSAAHQRFFTRAEFAIRHAQRHRNYNGIVPLPRFIAVAFAVLSVIPALTAAPDIFPLKDIRPGQTGMGRTVFSGTKVEDFQVEILGVLENMGPKQNVILARLKGGPLAETGVLQGMSGSPVYIDGRLVGAVAMGFSGAKEAIAGIRPIEEMLGVDPGQKPEGRPATVAALERRAKADIGGAKLEDLATPLAFSGFSPATLERFAPQLKALGMNPLQGVSGGGNPNDALGDPSKLEPGSMISVQLLSGDLSVSADGTITAIDGDKIYAFGHRFLATGSTDFPFARAEVLALLPNVTSSFKISQAKEWMGTITQDRSVAVAGFTRRRAQMAPLEIKIGNITYHMRVIDDRVMTPLITQMALSSALDATQLSVGPATFTIRGKIDFMGGESVKLDNVYTGDVSVAALASLGAASPISYALGSGFDQLKVKDLSFEIIPVEQRNQLQIADVIAPRNARPGDDVELSVILSGEGGAEQIRRVKYHIPVGLTAGTLNFSVADSTSTNLLEYSGTISTPARTPDQVLTLLNGLRSNTQAYLRVWRAGNSYTVEGRDLPDPPASAALILTHSQPTGTVFSARGAKMDEIPVPGVPGAVVTGSKTVQIEVRD